MTEVFVCTVCANESAEVVSLHNTSESTTFAGSADIHLFAFCEEVGDRRLASRSVFSGIGITETELADKLLGGGSQFLKNTFLGLSGALSFAFTKSKLNGGVAIFAVGAFYLKDSVL